MDIQEIIERYEAGESLASLGRKNNCDSRIIKSYLEKRNIHIRNRSEQTKITNIARTKSVNHNYFNEIDNNNKAWLLGFLTADGYITKNRNTISIGLSSTDEEILIKIKEELEIERAISHKETGNGFQVSTLEWSSQNQKEKHRPQAHLSLRCNKDCPACSPDRAFLSYAAFLKLCTETP